MSEKRFENRLNKDNIKFNTLNPVWDNEKEDALNVFEMIHLLNELNDENKNQKDFINQLQEELVFFKTANVNVIQGLEEENKELKKEIKAKNEIIEMYYELVEE